MSGTLVLGVIALVLTFSRMGWGSFVISIGVFLVIVFNKEKRIKTVAFSLVVIGIISTIAFLSLDLIQQRLFTDDYGSASTRIPFMKNSFHMIIDNPLFGVGTNNYSEASLKYDVEGVIWNAKRPHPKRSRQ